MTYDPLVPLELKKTQEWFASIISRPININSEMNPISPSGAPMSIEASSIISPSPTLKSHQRIELYNQQFWWRMLSTLQDAYPMLTRLFGFTDFNQIIAVPYLLKYPSNFWSLNTLGERLPLWIQEEYEGKDKNLIYNCSEIDNAFYRSFLAPDGNIIKDLSFDFEFLSDKLIQLTSTLYLFKLNCDLFDFRKKFLKKDPEYWMKHAFPKLNYFSSSQFSYTVLYRNTHNHILLSKIEEAEYVILKQLENGISLDALCEWIEKQPHESTLYRECVKNFSSWFKKWVSYRWLCCTDLL